MNSVLVLDAQQRSALATTRSLGRRGLNVYTSDSSEDSLAGASRYSIAYLRYPDPASQPEAFIDRIRQICDEQDIDMLMPVTELTTSLILQNSSAFKDISLPFADIDIIEELSDKVRLMHRAERLGIPYPETLYFDDRNRFDATSAPDHAVVKPARTWFRTGDHWLRGNVIAFEDIDSLIQHVASDAALDAPFMLQSFIPGHGAGIFALYERGQARAFFAHDRLREKPPGGGVSVLSESIEPDPRCLEYSKQLLDDVGWHGVAMVEFRIDDEGVPHLMEVNTRLWGSLQLAIDSGVDFPWLLHQISTGEAIGTINARTGRRLRWLLGDVDHLYLVLRDSSIPLSRKIRHLLNWMIPHPFTTRHEIDRLDDLRPAFWELKRYISDLRR